MTSDQPREPGEPGEPAPPDRHDQPAGGCAAAIGTSGAQIVRLGHR